MRFENSSPPPIGSQWRQTKMPERVVTVVRVVPWPDAQSTGWYVYIKGPWFKSGMQGRAMETFLKQYDPIPAAKLEAAAAS